MTYSSVTGLRSSLDGPVLTLTFDRAAQRNAVNDVMLDALIAHIATAGTDERVRVIRIDAEGPDFCAGSDLIANNAKTERKPRVGSTQRRLPTKANRLIPVMTETQVPIVAVVRGWTAGLGFHIALASDFCIAACDARFWEPFMARGFTPDSGAAWLCRESSVWCGPGDSSCSDKRSPVRRRQTGGSSRRLTQKLTCNPRPTCSSLSWLNHPPSQWV
jgi:2-(1,2-epoxy-1,2-dihydrophenyl)acetyl-CoA isomerase